MSESQYPSCFFLCSLIVAKQQTKGGRLNFQNHLQINLQTSNIRIIQSLVVTDIMYIVILCSLLSTQEKKDLCATRHVEMAFY